VAAGAGAAAAAAAVGGGVGGLDDLLGGGVSSAPAAAPAPAAAQTFPSVVAFDKDGLKVSLSFSKPSGPASATTVVVATASNSDAAKPVSSLALQAAVPKYLTLKLEPASGTSLPANNPGATITQRMHVTNASQGSKPLALRLRIVLARAAGEAPTTEVVELGADRLPAGL
jgi:AP-1 complex subunit gamma-1